MSIKQDKFAHYVAGGMKPRDAYIKAGFSFSNNNVLRASASRMHKQMQPRIAEILRVGQSCLDPDIETIEQTIKAFQKDVPWCREKLHDMINSGDTPPGVRLNAIKECLNRGLGLPVQYVETNMNVRYQISDQEMTEEEWFARYAKPVQSIPGPTEH